MRDLSIDNLFAGDEHGTSKLAYDRSKEINRRRFLAAQVVADAQVEAAIAQKAAAEAASRSAYWTRLSAIAVIIGVPIAVVAILLDVYLASAN